MDLVKLARSVFLPIVYLRDKFVWVKHAFERKEALSACQVRRPGGSSIATVLVIGISLQVQDSRRYIHKQHKRLSSDLSCCNRLPDLGRGGVRRGHCLHPLLLYP